MYLSKPFYDCVAFVYKENILDFVLQVVKFYTLVKKIRTVVLRRSECMSYK